MSDDEICRPALQDFAYHALMPGNQPMMRVIPSRSIASDGVLVPQDHKGMWLYVLTAFHKACSAGQCRVSTAMPIAPEMGAG